MTIKRGLSPPLLLTIMLPIVGGLLLFALVLASFEAGHRVAVQIKERDIEELVELAGSTIEEWWVEPRSEVVLALSRSDTLRRRLNGEAPFEELAEEWKVAQHVLDGYFFIYYGLEDGTIEHYPNDPLPDDYDPRVRPWYRLGMKSEGEPLWTAPYEEIITGEMVVSTVVSIPAAESEDDVGLPIGVLSTDMTFAALNEGLENMELPTDGSVFMVDKGGDPFIGTDDEIVQRDELPQSSEELYVESSSPLSSGWRVSVVVPRESLAENFAALRRPIIIASAVLLLLLTLGLSVLVGRIASRAHHLAAYFREAVQKSQPLRELFRSQDEFSYLNRRFNEVVRGARLAEEEKLARERTFRFLVEQAPVGFFRSQKDGTLLYLNAHCAAMLGYAREEAYGRVTSVRDLYDDQRERDRFLEELTEKGEVRNRKLRFIKKSGERIWVSMTARLDSEIESPGEFRIEGFLIDVTADVAERENLVALAESDPLTGVLNRRAFDAAAQELARHAGATGQSVAALVFDIDEFKPINDTHGHDVGDALLQRLVSVARGVIRKHDVFARLGGDEFGVVLPHSGEDAAFRLAERLVEQMKTTPPPQGITIQPTLSIGVAALAGGDVYVPELIKAADTAMYHAKRGGRNRIVRASELGGAGPPSRPR